MNTTRGIRSRQAVILVFALLQAIGAALLAEEEAPTSAIPQLSVGGDTGSLIATLDAPQFLSRDEASQRLAEKGPAVIPDLVEALGDPSAEVRFRATLLLSQRHSFEEVAFPLVNASEKPYSPRVRMVLRERTLQQLEAVCQMPYAEKLFKFWGTDLDAFCNQTLKQLDDAKSLAQTRQAIEPLAGMERKAKRFDEAISQLESLSLSYDHQYSPGYVIADTLARGLRVNEEKWTGFAERHLESLQRFAATWREKNESKYAIHKEVLDRANMSQGAAAFLVTLLDDASPSRSLLDRHVGISTQELQDSFCDGLANPDPHACDCGVGKVHVVDMLIESLTKTEDQLGALVCQRLVKAITEAARSGDKPKALALLDAMETCRNLRDHRLKLDEGLGKQLTDRLVGSALQSASNREFHPTLNVHNKLVALTDLGITTDQNAFPSVLLKCYLDGEDRVMSDAGRLALERYVRAIERLREAEVDLRLPEVDHFLCALRDAILDRADLLAAGLGQLDQALRAAKKEDGKVDASRVVDSLSAWTRGG